MKEIGSEFWSAPVTPCENGIFPENTGWFLSGRVALRSVIEDIKAHRSINSVFLPSWCCESMISPFLQAGISVDFYPVYIGGEGLVCQYPHKGDGLLTVDYFGYTDTLPDFDGVVIRDMTHSVFSSTMTGADYYFGSLRKWCGVATGGFAVGAGATPEAGADLYIELRSKGMEQKAEYINGKRADKGFLKLFAAAEEKLDACGIVSATAKDIDTAKKLDVDYIVKKRRENARILTEELNDICIFKSVAEGAAPLFVPICIENRDKLRRYLTDNGVYCPVHWPVSEMHAVSGKTAEPYEKGISLICDQRYGTEDMERIAKLVKKGIKLC